MIRLLQLGLLTVLLTIHGGIVGARTLADIRGSGELRICTAGSSSEFYRINAQAFASYLGVSSKAIRLDSWDQQFQDVNGVTRKDASYEAQLLITGQCDLFPNDLHMTPWRKTKMKLVPYYRTRKMIVTNRDLRHVFREEADLAGHSAAIQKGTAYETWLLAKNESSFSSKPVRIELAPTETSMKMVADGQAEFTVIGSESAFKWVRGDLENLNLLFPVDDLVEVGWGISPTANDLNAQLEAFFSDSLRVGSPLDRSWQRYYGISLMEYHIFESSIDSEETKRKELLTWVVPIMAALTGISLAMLFWARQLRKEVNRRRETEDALRKSQAMFSSAFENAASGMATVSIQGEWMEVNSALSSFLGYSADALKRLHFEDVSDPDELPLDRTETAKLLNGDMPYYQRAKRYIHRDGHRIWGLVTISVVRDAHGTPLFNIVQIVDINARKHAEDSLQLTHALLEESQEIAKVGGWELNTATGELHWTTETFRIHETTPESFNPTVDAGVGFFLPESRPRIERALKLAFDEHIGYDLELETLTTKGNRIEVRTTGTPWVVEGKLVRLSGIFQDITERKQHERLLKQALENAEQAASIKGQFLANMSHEIRTPMNAILGLLHMLQTTELTARQRDYASKTEGAAKSLLSLINDILDFSKMEAGKMQLEHEPFRIDEFLRNLSVVMSSTGGPKRVEMLFDVDPSLPEVVVGDAMRLQQTLINLGSNAIKFTLQGQVVLSLRKLASTTDTVTIEFAVQDSGIGIAPEHQAHIFSGFSQAEGSTTRRFGGTGLGLSISSQFVGLMGGHIKVTSKLGVGSTFSFVLEMPAVVDPPLELRRPASNAVAPNRVLVVDDNPMAGQLLLDMVRSWGWSADLANSGAHALKMIAFALEQSPSAFAYSLIYLDSQMPNMDGWETARRIHNMAGLCEGPAPTIIMLAAHGHDTHVQRPTTEPKLVDGFLVKPITGSMLFDAFMDATTDRSRSSRPVAGRSSQRRLTGMRILVAEDNLINQQVADELLSAEGAIVSLAANGQLAVEAVAAAAPQFDAILMDVQMPVLDGYGATITIRTELGLTELPIIAMTANAMASDRDTCLEVGMDEHIGKPFDIEKLVELLLRMTEVRPPATPDLAATDPVLAEIPIALTFPGLDLDAALARMSGMRSLYARTARDFSKELENTIPELRVSVLAGDVKASLTRLHTLKGNAGTLGANDLATMAAELESLLKVDKRIYQCSDRLLALTLLAETTRESLVRAAIHLETAALPTD